MSAQRKLAVLERRKGLIREGISRCCLRDFMAFTQPLHFCSEMSKQSTLTYFSSILLVQSSLSCTFLSTVHTNIDTPITAEKLGVPYFTQGHLNEFRINFLLFYCICGFVYGLPGPGHTAQERHPQSNFSADYANNHISPTHTFLLFKEVVLKSNSWQDCVKEFSEITQEVSLLKI